MITAWVYYLTDTGEFKFSELQGTAFDSTNPEDWGQPKDTLILLVLQKASFLSAFVKGKQQTPKP